MNEPWCWLAQCRKMLLYSPCAFSCMRSGMQETPSEPVPASAPPFSQQRQDQGTRALQHTPTLGPVISQTGWAEWDLLVTPVPVSTCEECVRKWSGRGSWGTFQSCSKPGCLVKWADQGLGHVPRHRRAPSCSGRVWKSRGELYSQPFPAGGTGKNGKTEPALWKAFISSEILLSVISMHAHLSHYLCQEENRIISSRDLYLLRFSSPCLSKIPS